MNNIPNISFDSKIDQNNFELLNLTELFDRLDSIETHNPTLPHKIDFFAVLIVTKGSGTHQVDLQEYEITEGTVLKLAKGQVHAFQKSPNYEGYLFLFTEDFVMNYFLKSSINLISHLYNYHLTSPITSNKTGNTSFIHELKIELQNPNKYAKNDIIAALLMLYLLRLERFSTSTETQQHKSKKYDSFIQFKNLVESNYTQTRNVQDYANKMLISTKQLNHIVQEFTINTAKSFIDNYVILEAKRELVSTNKSIKEVAYSIGFDEVTNYTKFFKKKVHCTPKEFRAKQPS